MWKKSWSLRTLMSGDLIVLTNHSRQKLLQGMLLQHAAQNLPSIATVADVLLRAVAGGAG